MGSIIPLSELSKHPVNTFQDEQNHDEDLQDNTKANNDRKRIVDELIHADNDFLEAAEMGDHELIEELLRDVKTNINQLDHLGRNALHLAVCSEDEPSIVLLLAAGVNPNVKDKLGMTPLSLCLLRCPSVRVANLLFDHGAVILPRTGPTDTGLFMSFTIMCTPTLEEEQLLHLLVKKGCEVNDRTPSVMQPLHFAAMSNNSRLVEVLMDLGADLFALNSRGETPKEVALYFNCKEASKILEEMEELYTPSTSATGTTTD